ncbi:hypothetical protein BDV3_004075 [Batrachochytrium dendrobatidis]
MELSAEAVCDTLKTISDIPVLPVIHRHVYFILGKPLSGKTTLGRKLATYTDTMLVCPETALDYATSTEISPNKQQLLEHLANGGSIPSEQIVKMMQESVISNNSEYKGYIVDGLPCGLNAKNTIDLESPPLDMAVLHKIVQEKNKGHIPVLIDLQISDENLIRRRASQWIDPSTNIGYSGQQVLYSRTRRSQGWVDGQEDTVALSEMESQQLEFYNDALDEHDANGKNNTTDAVDEAEREDLDETAIQDNELEDDLPPASNNSKQKKRLEAIKNKKTWPILSEQILDRLIKRPEDNPDQSSKDLIAYHKYEAALNDFKKKYFDLLRVITLDASQHPDVVFHQLKQCLITRNFSLYTMPVKASRLALPEADIEGMSKSDVFQYYASQNLKEFEPVRSMGYFGKHCPVTFYNNGTLVEGDLKFAALYRGSIYYFSSEAYAETFVENPYKFLQKPLAVSDIYAVFIGPPHSGKTLQAKLLAERYGLNLISLDSQLKNWEQTCLVESTIDQTSETKEALENNIYFKIKEHLKNGTVISTKLLIDVIKLCISQQNTHGKRFNGWVLDGYPCNAEQAEALVSSGLSPKYLFTLKSEIDNSEVLSRWESPRTDALGNYPVNEFDIGINVNPYYNKLYSSYKENISGIVQILENSGATVVDIPADQSISMMINQVVACVDPFVPQASPLSANSNRGTYEEFGLTKDYCPVTLKLKNVLLKGSKEISANFLNHIYYFSSEDARVDFCKEPAVYLSNIKIPPPRIVFMGPAGSGKTTCICALSKKWNIPHVEFRSLLVQFAHSLEQAQEEDIMTMIAENATIPSTIMTDVFEYLFTLEPYVSKGFLLEGFPQTKQDLDVVIKKNYALDAFVMFQVSPEIAAKRVMRAKKTGLNLSNKNDDQKIVVDKNAQLPLSENEPQEISDEELFGELMSSAEKENEQFSEYLTILSNARPAPTIEVNASKNLRPILAFLERKLCKFMEKRECLLCNVIPISTKHADTLLKLGTKQYSSIGKYCPVSLQKPNQSYAPIYGTKPVIFGNCIYYLKDILAKNAFISSPLDYTINLTPQPVVLPTVCILGGPKSGKTSISENLALELNAVYINAATAIQAIINGDEITALYDNLKHCLDCGKGISEELVLEAIMLISARTINAGHGWVLDGFPETFNQAVKMEQQGFRPSIFIELSIDDSNVQYRRQADKSQNLKNFTPHLDIKEVVELDLAQFNQQIVPIQSVFSEKYSNWNTIDARNSKWATKHIAHQAICHILHQKQTYIYRKNKGLAAPIHGVGISKDYIDHHLCSFKNYCPVSLLDSKELIQVSKSSPYLTEYMGLIYCFAGSSELQSFMDNPDKYAQSAHLLEHLPIHRSRFEVKAMFPKQLELKGYCPVTFSLGKSGFSSILIGSNECVVEYIGKLYAMHSKVEMDKFMRKPWAYVDQILPSKLPPPIAPLPISGLPVIGYMEQTLSTALTSGLRDLGHFKPKFPYLSIEISACKYLALYLKANNPHSKDWVRSGYALRLQTFKSKCKLMQHLASTLTRENGSQWIENRDEILDQQLSEFLLHKTMQNRVVE